MAHLSIVCCTLATPLAAPICTCSNKSRIMPKVEKSEIGECVRRSAIRRADNTVNRIIRTK